jgi:hypothetical protein
MLRILILTMVLAAIPSDIDRSFKSQNQSDCPNISVSCPDDIDSTKPVKFTAKVAGGKPHGELSYGWSVTKGTIKSGQGTSTIEVDLNGQDCQGLTVTVEVNGIDPNCTRVVSCAVCIQ